MLYKLQMDAPKALVSSNSLKDQGGLWHRRISHIHHGALKLLHETMIAFPEASIEHDDVFRGCVLGQFAKATFPRSDNKLRGMLDLVHLDICGPMSTKYLRGYKYFDVFIDNFSRKS